MDINNKPFNGYGSGADTWRDNVLNYGTAETIVICGNYLDMNLRRKQSDDEKQHCWEMFAAWYEATADKIDSAKLVYPYSFKIANDRFETSYYHESRRLNAECARGIDTLITASNYAIHYYNLELAAMKAVMDYGFARVNLVLAFNIQKKENDGRLSSTNKRWAKRYKVPEQAFDDTWLQVHTTLIDSFADYFRQLYIELCAERFVLPGIEERGEDVNGYAVKRTFMVDDHQGYVIAHNPDAVSPWVCWQFYIRDGERSYNWGIYGEEQDAIDGFNARQYIAFNQGGLK
jgi:hypothetical protein